MFVLQEELLYVIYKLPTVIISRRTDQYSKAYESLMGQQPLQGPPFRSKAPQNQPRVPTLAPSPPIMVQHTTPAVIHSQPDRLQRAPSFGELFTDALVSVRVMLIHLTVKHTSPTLQQSHTARKLQSKVSHTLLVRRVRGTPCNLAFLALRYSMTLFVFNPLAVHIHPGV